MFFWRDDKSPEEEAAERLLNTSQDELRDLREDIEERNDELSIKISSHQRKIQKLMAQGQEAPDHRKRILAQKCSQLERKVKKARRELKENLNQLSTLGVAELLVEGRKSDEFTEAFKELIGAENPSEFRDALHELQTREEMNREERDRLTQISDTYDAQYEAAEESDPDKFLAKMQGGDEDEEEIDPFAEPEPVETPAIEEDFEEDEPVDHDRL